MNHDHRQKVALVLRLLLSLVFVGGGINHFLDPAFYLRIMPDYFPAHELLVQLSGVTEIVVGAMLLIRPVMHWGARLMIAHLVVFLTVHFWMVQHAADRYADVPLVALWLRIVIQFVLIGCAAVFVRAQRTPRST